MYVLRGSATAGSVVRATSHHYKETLKFNPTEPKPLEQSMSLCVVFKIQEETHPAKSGQGQLSRASGQIDEM